MIKLFHIADVHFDSTFRTRGPDVRRSLTESLLQSFERAVTVALEREVDAFLIAGDLMDSDYLSLQTERWLIRQIQRLLSASVVVVYATGNHDSRVSNSLLPKLPAGVVVASGSDIVDTVVDKGLTRLRILAAGHESTSVSLNLVSTFPEARPGEVTVGVVHAYVAGVEKADNYDKYAPCSIADLASRNYNYWALGHIHESQCVDSAAKAWYCGTPQGRSYRESGIRGGLFVTIDDDVTNVENVPLSNLVWIDVDLQDLVSLETVVDLEEVVVSTVQAALAEHPEASDFCVRVRLVGPCHQSTQLASEAERKNFELNLKERLEVLDLELDVTKTHLPVDLEEIKAQRHLVSELIMRVAGMSVKTAREFLPDQLATDADVNDETLAVLIDQIDIRIVERFDRSSEIRRR